MSDFWDNVLRYPRFFISSLVGLIFVILTPFRSLFKIKKFQILLPIGIFIIFGTLFVVLKNMTGF